MFHCDAQVESFFFFFGRTNFWQCRRRRRHVCVLLPTWHKFLLRFSVHVSVSIGSLERENSCGRLGREKFFGISTVVSLYVLLLRDKKNDTKLRWERENSSGIIRQIFNGIKKHIELRMEENRQKKRVKGGWRNH